MFLSPISAPKIAPEHGHPTRKKEVKAALGAGIVRGSFGREECTGRSASMGREGFGLRGKEACSRWVPFLVPMEVGAGMGKGGVMEAPPLLHH